MLQGNRNTTSRLVRISFPQETGCEVGLNYDQMEPPHEEKQSQQGVERNLNAYRFMRDHIHPPRMGAPSCIGPPTDDMVGRPHMVPLLLTFHGLKSENPYTHIMEYEKVCNTFKEDATTLDLMRLKLFPFTLKDKAKI